MKTQIYYLVISLHFFASINFGQDSLVNKIVPDFMVNTENNNSSKLDKSFSVISKSKNGNYIITWSDRRDGYSSIYAQLFSKDGLKIGKNFKVSTLENRFTKSIETIFLENGDFIVFWCNYLNNTDQLWAQKFNSIGEKIGEHVQVSNSDEVYHHSVSISTNYKEKIIVSWVTWQNGVFNLEVKEYDNNLLKLNNIIQLNNFTEEYNEYYGVKTCISQNGNIILSWKSQVNSIQKNNIQLFNENGETINHFFSDEFPIKIKLFNYNQFAAIYENTNDKKLKIDIFSSEGLFIESMDCISYTPPLVDIEFLKNSDFYLFYKNITLNTEDGLEQEFIVQKYNWLGNSKWLTKINGNNKHYNNVIQIDTNSFVICWDYSVDIFVQNISEQDSVELPIYMVNDDIGFSYDLFPDLLVDKHGNFNVVWERNNNIFYQKMDSIGNKIEGNVQLNNEAGNGSNIIPHIIEMQNGNNLVVWLNYLVHNVFDYENNIYFQLIEKDSLIIDNNYFDTKIEDNNHAWYPSIIPIAENLLIVWENNSNLYFRIYNKSCEPISEISKINDNIILGILSKTKLQITNNSVLITWSVFDNSSSQMIFGQIIDSLGNKVGSNIHLNKDTEISNSTINTDKFIALWDNNDIYVRLISVNGEILSNSIKVNERSQLDDDYFLEREPVISVGEDGKFIVVWHNNNSVIGQRFNSDFKKIGNNCILSSNNVFDKLHPQVKLKNEKIYTVWVNKDLGYNDNIYGNIIDFNTPIVKIEKENDIEIPSSYALYQNYPNPFNPTTKIKYSIPANEKRETANVKLIVYDVLGKAITTLVNENKSPGNYDVEFNASYLSSGIYFYKIQAGKFIETRKMILIK